MVGQDGSPQNEPSIGVVTLSVGAVTLSVGSVALSVGAVTLSVGTVALSVGAVTLSVDEPGLQGWGWWGKGVVPWLTSSSGVRMVGQEGSPQKELSWGAVALSVGAVTPSVGTVALSVGAVTLRVDEPGLQCREWWGKREAHKMN